MTFATSVTYAQALRTVTDLGLQPDLNCTEGRQTNGQRAQFASKHALVIQEAYLANAPDAWTRLAATPGVVRVQNAWAEEAGISVPTDAANVGYLCPSPTPGIAQLTHEGNVVYAQAVFDASQTYDDALYIVSDLGLQLADPCYEQALLAQESPVWHSMGQESAYPAAHTLSVQTAAGTTPVIWQQLLSATPGVTQVITPYTAQC